MALLAAGLGGASPASAACENPFTPTDLVNCVVPVTGTYTFNVALDSATQSASGVPGDPGASGSASITMNAGGNQVCWTYTVSGAGTVASAGIYEGGRGQPASPVPVVPFTSTSGCSLVAPGEIGVMVKCPGQFNVTVRTLSHPAGAIRGQLGSTCSA